MAPVALLLLTLTLPQGSQAHALGTPQPGRPATVAPSGQGGTIAPVDAAELYRRRTHRPNAQAAADIWATSAETDFAAAWMLARVCYWLGTHGSEPERREALERGVKAGEMAVRLAAGLPEGHFWMAASMGALGEDFGMSQGLKYRGRIKEALERVIAIQPGWQQGSPEAALGRWYARVPRLLGGNKGKAEAHLKRALEYGPFNRLALVYYAELVEEDRPAEARALLERVLKAPPLEGWGPEDDDWAYRAKERLARIRP